MLFRRSIRNLNSLSLPVAALAVSASTLAAQGRPLFQWSGRVDREVRIAMHGRDARTLNTGRVPAARSPRIEKIASSSIWVRLSRSALTTIPLITMTGAVPSIPVSST